MAELAFYLLVFVATFLATAGASWLAWRLLSRHETKTSGTAGKTETPAEAPSEILRQEVLSTLSVFALVLSHLRFVKNLKRLLAEANMNWSVGRTIALMLLAGGLTMQALVSLDLIPFVGSLLCAAGLAATPIFYIRGQRAKRFRQIEEQLPEALEYLSRALIAGHSLVMSMELLAEEAGPPLSAELRKTVDEYNLGMSLEDALVSLAARTPSVDIRFFVSAIMTQSRTGGNLHELLENLADTIRERASLKSQVRALTAHGRLTAMVLSLLPFALAAIMIMVSPDYFLILVRHPIGKTLLFCVLIGQVLAYFVIKRIADIKV